MGSKVQSWDRKFSLIESQWIMYINHYSITAWKYCYAMDTWTWGTQLINYFFLGFIVLASDGAPYSAISYRVQLSDAGFRLSGGWWLWTYAETRNVGHRVCQWAHGTVLHLCAAAVASDALHWHDICVTHRLAFSGRPFFFKLKTNFIHENTNCSM